MDKFLNILSVVDQGTVDGCLNDDPRYYWVLKNMDFEEWASSDSSDMLWLSGPPQSGIRQISEYIVDFSTRRSRGEPTSVLYFFGSSVSRENSALTVFVHSLLSQFIGGSPEEERMSIAKAFLHGLLEAKLRASSSQRLYFDTRVAWEEETKKILHAQPNELWAGLEGALTSDTKRKFSIVVDGLDNLEHRENGFVEDLSVFLSQLQERNVSVKALLTSRHDGIEKWPERLRIIEYDKERQGLM